MTTTSPGADAACLIECTTRIISAYCERNPIQPDAIPSLIGNVYGALAKAATPAPEVEPEPELKPAVPIRRSITDDAIICLEDGLPFRSLKRHLRVKYNLTPEQYRERWGLPADYPMVAPSYSAKRSQLAKDNGLGTKK